MSMFSIGSNTTVTTSGAAAMEIRAASGYPFRVRSIEITLAAATASTYGLGRPAAIGVTPTSPVAMVAEMPDDSATTPPSTAVAWGTGPTIPTVFMKRVTLPATIGSGVTWNYESNQLYLMPVNAAAGVASLVLWNLAANSANTNVNFRGEV